jgi:hypothetical protein
MYLNDIYRTLDSDERILASDQWTLASLLASNQHVWAPCDSFAGRRTRDIADRNRIVFRRLVCHEVRPAGGERGLEIRADGEVRPTDPVAAAQKIPQSPAGDVPLPEGR